MKLVSATDMNPGMILGRDIFNEQHQLMLSAGQILTERQILKIRQLGIWRAYVLDDGESLESPSSEEPISRSLRQNAVDTVRELFHTIGQHEDAYFGERYFSNLKIMVNNMIEEITQVKKATLCMTNLKEFDDYTYFHSVDVAVMSLVLGTKMGLKRDDLFDLGLGAMLHDIGKIFVPKKILNKEQKLTPEEFEEIKSHSLKGYTFLANQWNIPAQATEVALSHHEKYDGTGYPNRLKGEAIPPYGRITAVADVFDALTSDRPYRRALSPSEAMEYIKATEESISIRRSSARLLAGLLYIRWAPRSSSTTGCAVSW
jgi:HD-GYP domain-containing protein (c-di-GMP phosphodiesterase class II)